MNKTKTSLTVLSIIYCDISFLSIILTEVFWIVINGSFLNINTLLNWLIQVSPFVLILVYCFAFYSKPQGKLFLRVIIIVQLSILTLNVLTMVISEICYNSSNSISAIAMGNLKNILFMSLGVGAFVILLLYVLNIFKNKIIALIIAYTYFTISLLTPLKSVSLNMPMYLIGVDEKYMLYLSVVNLFSLILAGVGSAIWLIFTKAEILRD